MGYLNRFRPVLASAWLVASAVWGAWTPAASATPYVEFLWERSSDDSLSYVEHISFDGRYIVGTYRRSVEFPTHVSIYSYGFFWDQGALKVFDSPADRGFSPIAVSEDGLVVGHAEWAVGDVGSEAAVWRPGEAVTRLDPTFSPTTRTGGYAIDITPDGRTVLLGKGSYGWTLLHDGSIIDEGYGGPRAISADGRVIAGDGFRWTADTGRVSLPSPWQWRDATAWDVSADGGTLVGTVSNSLTRPAVWDDSLNVELLELLPGTEIGYADSVSGDGAIIVGTVLREHNWVAVMWDRDRRVHELNSLVTGLGEGWSLTRAQAVSGNGQVIAGEAFNVDTREWAVFRVVLPEPLTLFPLALGMAIFGRRLGRRR